MFKNSRIFLNIRFITAFNPFSSPFDKAYSRYCIAAYSSNCFLDALENSTSTSFGVSLPSLSRVLVTTLKVPIPAAISPYKSFFSSVVKNNCENPCQPSWYKCVLLDPLFSLIPAILQVANASEFTMFLKTSTGINKLPLASFALDKGELVHHLSANFSCSGDVSDSISLLASRPNGLEGLELISLDLLRSSDCFIVSASVASVTIGLKLTWK